MVKIGSIGYSAIVDDLQGHPFAIIPANLAKVTVNSSRINKKYLQYWLTSPSIKEYLVNSASKTAQPALSLSKIKNTPVLLPPLPEQKRIAAILDKADSIRRKRQEAVRLTEELLRSVFLDMFGDPVVNPKGWKTKSLSEEIEFLTSGSRGWAEFYSNTGKKFIRIQNVKNGLLHFSDVQYVNPPDNKEAARTKVQENDLLISITADLGRTAVVDKKTAIEGAHINQHLALVRLSKAFNPHFVAAYLESEGGKRQFLQLDQSAVKSGLNFDSIKSLNLFDPPLQMQNRYASFVHALERAKGKQRTSSDETANLFNSLLQRALKGLL
jgi:type I restriction enzyme S subunit